MANQKVNRVPDGPTLLQPRREAVVHGERVHFQWKPVEGAGEYVLQVASDQSFDEIVYEQNTGRETAATVEHVFETDERTYFWRVEAHNEAGWSHGENIESFLSGTAEDAETHAVSPEEEEEYGPVGAISKAAAVEVAADVTGDEELFEREQEMGVAHEGVEAKQILALILVVILGIIGLIVTLVIAVGNVTQQQQMDVIGISGYPERVESESEAAALLQQYEVVDEEAGVYRIPVERAKELMVNEERQRPAREDVVELTVTGENR